MSKRISANLNHRRRLLFIGRSANGLTRRRDLRLPSGDSRDIIVVARVSAVPSRTTATGTAVVVFDRSPHTGIGRSATESIYVFHGRNSYVHRRFRAFRRPAPARRTKIFNVIRLLFRAATRSARDRVQTWAASAIKTSAPGFGKNLCSACAGFRSLCDGA